MAGEPEFARIPGVILAGGLATRMGGRDKGLLALGRATLLDQVIARVAPQCACLAINANGDPDRFSRFGLPVVPDTVPDFPGPLAGILAALDWAAGEGARAVVTVAADTPFPPADLVVRLQRAAAEAGVEMAVAASPDEAGALRRHPTFGLWPVALRGELRADLEAGVRKVSAFADRHKAASAVFSAHPFDPFFNVNTPQDLARAAALPLSQP